MNVLKRKYLEIIEKICLLCKASKTLEHFSKQEKAGDGYYTYCKECASITKKKYRASLTDDKFIQKMLQDSKGNVKRGNGRVLKHEVTLPFAKSLRNLQQTKCAKSGIPLNFQSGRHFQASLDRIEEDATGEVHYIPGSVRFVCFELNGATTWKFDDLVSANKTPLTEEELVQWKQQFDKKPVKRNHSRRQIRDDETLCNKCKSWKSNDKFSKNQYTCKECQNLTMSEYNKTWIGVINGLINSAIRHTKTRQKRRKMEDVKMTHTEVKELFVLQKGLCAYSDIRQYYYIT
jgi:tRNA G26 N,N-dimethylase Trm1